MPIHRHLNPENIGKPGGYTHVVEAVGPGRIVYISGQLGLDRDNRLVGAAGDFRAQAEQTFVNLQSALAAVGARFEHVVKLNTYLTDISHLSVLRDVRERHVDTAAPPASTTIAISALARAGALIEIEAVAIVPHRTIAARAKTLTRRSKRSRGAGKPSRED